MLQDLTETEPGHGGANLFIQSQTQTPSLLLAPPFTLTFAQTSQIKMKAFYIFLGFFNESTHLFNKYPSPLGKYSKKKKCEKFHTIGGGG